MKGSQDAPHQVVLVHHGQRPVGVSGMFARGPPMHLKGGVGQAQAAILHWPPVFAQRFGGLGALLAPAGAYGGDFAFPETDMIWGTLPSIAENVLRIPVSDPEIFYTNAENRKLYENDIKKINLRIPNKELEPEKTIEKNENENENEIILTIIKGQTIVDFFN